MSDTVRRVRLTNETDHETGEPFVVLRDIPTGTKILGPWYGHGRVRVAIKEATQRQWVVVR